MSYTAAELFNNLNQIIKLNTKSKLIEINDKLQLKTLGNTPDGIELSSSTPKNMTSNMHSNYSKLEVIILDYSSSTSKVASINLDPCEVKTIAALFFSSNISFSSNNILIPVFSKVLRIIGGIVSKIPNFTSFVKHLEEVSKVLKDYEQAIISSNSFYSCEKINPYSKNEHGKSPVSKMTITYCPNLNLKWKINIECGEGETDNTQTGGLICKKGSYKNLQSLDIYMSQLQMAKLLKISSDYIERWELCNMSAFLKYRSNTREYLKSLLPNEQA